MKNLKFTLILLSFISLFLLSCRNTQRITTATSPAEEKTCINPSKITNAACTKEYAPVCGCNNVTYGNKCMAKNAGLTSWKSGECEE